tara:strand:- start:414 stop:1742 length:1329 start_codon:yes stop_codon:yes gene_type:complete
MPKTSRKFFKYSLIFFFLASCGGGGSAPNSIIESSTEFFWQTATPESVGLTSAKVNAALDYAISDGLFTQSVIILKEGKIIGEKYRSISELEKNTITSNHSAITDTFLDSKVGNITSSSLVTSMSVGKSFTSILFGIAQDKGLLSINSKASDYLTEWLQDSRQDITIKNLLDMRSGLNRGCYGVSELDEIGNCVDIPGASTIGGGDIARANNQLTGCINQTFNHDLHGSYNASASDSYYLYSNCDTMILGEIFYRATSQNINAFAETNLFSKLDISAEWWKDNSNGGQDNGNYLTYCCIDMTARDFIKFGQLLLNDGLWENERILSPSYVQQIKDLTTYGLKFWSISSNYISSPSPSVSKFIFAIGFDGQYIGIDFENNIIIARNSLYYPSLDLSPLRKVVVGFLGTTNFPVTLPTVITTNGETRLNATFNIYNMTNLLYSQ